MATLKILGQELELWTVPFYEGKIAIPLLPGKTEDGETWLKVQELHKIVSSLPGERVEIWDSDGGDKLHLRSDFAEVVLDTIGILEKDYRIREEGEVLDVGIFDARILEETLQRALRYVSHDKTRPNIGGVFLDMQDGLMVVATNGRTLYARKLGGAPEYEGETLGPEYVKVLLAFLKDKTEVYLKVFRKPRVLGWPGGTYRVEFRVGDAVIRFPDIDLEFPNWRMIVPKDEGLRWAELQAKPLKKALGWLKKMVGADAHVTIQAGPGDEEAILKAKPVSDKIRHKEVAARVPIRTEDPLDLMFSVEVLEMTTGWVQTETLKLGWVEEGLPVKVMSGDGDGDEFVLGMPVKRME